MMANEHGVKGAINEPNREDDAKDEEALNRLLQAIGKTEEDIERMKVLIDKAGGERQRHRGDSPIQSRAKAIGPALYNSI